MAETNDIDSENNFKLNPDQIDSLRLEVQSLFPKEQAKLEELVGKCNQQFLGQYKEYIPSEKVMTDSEVTKKFLIMDPDVHHVFDKGWRQLQQGQVLVSYAKPEDVEMRVYSKQGHFVEGYFPEVWRLLTSENQLFLIKQQGSLEAAQQYVEQRYQECEIAHELMHLYSGKELPYWFSETGAFWYSDKLTGSKVTSEEDTKRVKFYQSLIDLYGGVVHQIYFGRQISDSAKELISRRYTPEIQKEIFPDYHQEDPSR